MVHIERRTQNTALIEQMKGEIEAVRTGHSNSFTPTSLLALRFGYSSSDGVRQALRNAGVSEILHQIEHTEALPPLPQSEELAWTVGFLAKKGSMTSGERLDIEDDNDKRREAFKKTARLIPGFTVEENVQGKKRQKKVLSIQGRILLRRLGSLTQKEFNQTFREKYQWITEDESYIWNFLGGLFDSQGSFTNANIRFYSNDGDFLAIISEVLTKASLHPVIPKEKRRDSLSYVGLFETQSLQMFGENAVSKIPENQKELERFSGMVIQTQDPVERLRQRERFREQTGEKLSLDKMTRLRKEHLFPYSSKPIVGILGDGSYSRAASALSILDQLLEDHRANTIIPSHNLVALAIELARRAAIAQEATTTTEMATADDVGRFRSELSSSTDTQLTLNDVKILFDTCFGNRTITLRGAHIIADEAKEILKRICPAHRWKIGEQNGPRSHGVCKNCQAEKIFYNSLEASQS